MVVQVCENIFFGTEHRMRKEEMVEQFNKETKEGWSFAADAAKITDENQAARIASRRREATVIWVQSSTRKMDLLRPSLGMKGGIAQSLANVRGGVRVFAMYSLHSEGWTPRSETLVEAVVEHARTAGHPSLVTCYANVTSEGLKKSLWSKERCMFTEVPEERMSTCRSKGPCGEMIERNVSIRHCQSKFARKNTKDMDVVENFESRPRKAVTFLVDRDGEIQEWCELKMPTALPGIQRWKIARKKQG